MSSLPDMAHGRVRVRGHERALALQLPQPQLQLKDAQCPICRTRDPSAPQAAHTRNRRQHRGQFAPTGNRFSILAELDHQPTQATWAFDFVQPADSSARRRSGKRAGRQSRPKNLRQQQDGVRLADTEAATDELCAKIAALRLDGDETGQQSYGNAELKRSEREMSSPADHARQQWLPQALPQLLRPPPPLVLHSPMGPAGQELVQRLQPVERCFSDWGNASSVVEDTMTEVKRKESRFFPSSAFIAAPETTVRHPASTSARTSTAADLAKDRRTSVMPTPAFEAATSAAYRALDAQQCISTPPAAINNTPTFPPSGISPSTPIETTPFAAASAATAVSPALSAVPSLASSPSIISNAGSISHGTCRTPPGLHVLPHLTPTKRSDMQTWSAVAAPKKATPPSNLRLPPAPSPIFPLRPTVALPKPPHTTADPMARATPLSKSLFPAVPMSPAVRVEVEDFLGKGHARPCWCSASINSIDHRGSWPPDSTPPPQASTFLIQSGDSRPLFPQRHLSNSSLDSVLLTPTLTPSDSDFSDLGLYVEPRVENGNLTLVSDARSDDGWTAVSPIGCVPDAGSENQSCISLSSNDSDFCKLEREGGQPFASLISRADQETERTATNAIKSVERGDTGMAAQLYNPTEQLQTRGHEQLTEISQAMSKRFIAATALTAASTSAALPSSRSSLVHHVPQYPSDTVATTTAKASAIEWPSPKEAAEIEARQKKGARHGVSRNRGFGSGVAAPGGGVWLVKGTMRAAGHGGK